MAEKSTLEVGGFGRRLVAVRKQKGWSQDELARRSGLARRMVVYYEAQGGDPPAHVIVSLAKALDVSADQLLGLRHVTTPAPRDVRLWRRLLKVQDFPDKDRKFVTDLIETIETRSKTAIAS
jgi:transcriptional regulator with XRE-family HTH domain